MFVRGFVLVMMLPGAAWSQAAAVETARDPARSAPSYEAVVVDGEVSVDGELSEGVWRRASPIRLPYETFPGTNSAAPVETECRVAYDAATLYLGCTARDPAPGSMRAFVTDRDQLDGQDAIVLGLSPHDDGRRAFLFTVNPFGVQGDAVYDEARDGPDASWDAIWESAGRVSETGWVVEVGIPFRSLRFPARSGARSWGFFLERRWPRGSNVRVQSFREEPGESCRLCQINRLEGLSGIASGGAVQVTPTVSAARADTRGSRDAGWSAGELSPDLGLDVAWGVTSDVILNATVNPDFSQVEADAAQLDANQRFALFFPERRPFFLEGADLFSTPLDLAFTRTIADPDFGMKTTGKVGANAFGALLARDRVTGILVPGPYGSSTARLAAPAWAAMATYRRDVTGTATLGGLVTAREGADYHNRVGSVDAFFRPLPALQLRLQAGRSDTDYPDHPALADQPAGAFSGSLLYARATFDNRAWFGNLGYRRQDAGFRADAGFLPRTDIIQRWAFLSRRWYGTSTSFLSEARLAGGAWSDITTGDGDLISRGYWLTAMILGPGQTRLMVNPNIFTQRFAGRDFRVHNFFINASTSPVRWLAGGLTANLGTAVDYAGARPAAQIHLEPSLTLRPGPRAEARASYAFQRLDTRHGQRILDAGVAQARLVYNFSSRAFVRTILQYRRTDRAAATSEDPVEPIAESALTQLLFSYKVNPQTVLFLGYSDSRHAATTAGTAATTAGAPRDRLAPTGRSFFFKVGYAFQP